jgi:hypothetical protein
MSNFTLLVDSFRETRGGISQFGDATFDLGISRISGRVHESRNYDATEVEH